MLKRISGPLILIVAGALVILALLAVFGTPTDTTLQKITSSEFGVSSVSPNGTQGGLAIPASCPSFEHIPGECDDPEFTGTGSGGGPGSGPGSVITINVGDTVTLEWTCVNSSSSAGQNFSTGGATSGSVEVEPTQATTFTLVCSNGGEASVVVSLVNPTLSISASPGLIRPGETTTIVWSATDVDPGSCTVTGPNFSVAGEEGAVVTQPITQQSTFTLTCETPGGVVSQSTTVNLVPIIEEF